MDAKVCLACGGVALPPMSEQEDITCSTPGCTKHGEKLDKQEVAQEETITCPTCEGTFLKDSGHSHEE